MLESGFPTMNFRKEDASRIRLVAFDLDGTLTQHKSPLGADARAALDALRATGRDLWMVGAGSCRRIHRQMGGYPIGIVGNYGLQAAVPDAGAPEGLRFLFDRRIPCDRESVARRAAAFRAAHGFTAFAGDGVEFHESGVVTLALLGTQAALPDKLAFDPDRSRRRALLADVAARFPEFVVFVGGSSSFDMAPRPYDKARALDERRAALGLGPERILYVGDDYGPGGNDEAVFRSAYPFLPVDDYRRTPALLRSLFDL